jgi:hypothetical protein
MCVSKPSWNPQYMNTAEHMHDIKCPWSVIGPTHVATRAMVVAGTGLLECGCPPVLLHPGIDGSSCRPAPSLHGLIVP